MSSFLSRWIGHPEQEETLPVEPDRALPDSLPAPQRKNQGPAWSVSPLLERIQRELEDQIRTIEGAKRLLEDRLSAFQRRLQEQQKLLEQLAESGIAEEFEALASLCSERQAALERYAGAVESRPQGLFAELEGIYQKYKPRDAGKSGLFGRVLEQTRQADLRLQDTLNPLPRDRDDLRPPRVEATS